MLGPGNDAGPHVNAEYLKFHKHMDGDKIDSFAHLCITNKEDHLRIEGENSDKIL